MGLAKGIVGFGMSASLVAGGVWGLEHGAEKIKESNTQKACAQIQSETRPSECQPKSLESAANANVDAIVGGLLAFGGIIVTCAGGLVILEAKDELFSDDAPVALQAADQPSPEEA